MRVFILHPANVVGSGVFLTPVGVVQNVGSVGATLLLWAIMGLYTLGQALCYAELGSVIPKTGGDYTYIYEILGPIPGFLAVWGHVFVCVTTADAALGLTASLYILEPFGLQCNAATLTIFSALIIGKLFTPQVLSNHTNAITAVIDSSEKRSVAIKSNWQLFQNLCGRRNGEDHFVLNQTRFITRLSSFETFHSPKNHLRLILFACSHIFRRQREKRHDRCEAGRAVCRSQTGGSWLRHRSRNLVRFQGEP